MEDINGTTATQSFELSEPAALDIQLHPSVFEGGYNISKSGGQNGLIQAEVLGGVREYTYMWSTSSTRSDIENLSAGLYSVSVTDNNACSASKSITLIEPSPLNIVSISSPLHQGYNVSCNEGKDGAIDLSVSGGVPPYDYRWNDGNIVEDPTQLPAGHYTVIVQDRNRITETAQITLTEAPRLELALSTVVFSNGRHIS